MTTFTGGCLCGNVRYEGEGDHGGGHCYCVDCRRSSGTSHCTHMMTPMASFKVDGDVRFFEKPADSGNIVNRGFCPVCGSAVYSTNSAAPDLAFVRVSSLDEPDFFEPQMIVYNSRAPGWTRPHADLPSFEEMPPPPDMPPKMN